MPTTDASLAAAQAVDSLAASLGRLQRAARTASTSTDDAIADAIRRGQMPKLLDALTTKLPK